MSREEDVFHHRRIAFLSEVLQVVWKHRDFVSGLSGSDGVTTAIDLLKSKMNVSRHSRKQKGIGKRKALRHTTTMYLNTLFKTPSGELRKGEYKIDKIAKGKKYKERNEHRYNVTVRWTWMHKVWKPLYEGTVNHFSPYVILHAERVRVNSKHIELFEVQAFHKDTGDNVKGYVAKTKSPRQSCIFNAKAVLAVRGAEIELQAELDLLLKGTSND